MGDISDEQVSPLPGLRIDFFRHFRGLTPQAITCRTPDPGFTFDTAVWVANKQRNFKSCALSYPRVPNNSPEKNSKTMSAATQQSDLDVGQHPVVFFDGVCGLCDLSVKSLLKMDHQGKLRFAPLQGETAKLLLEPHDIQELKSLVICDSQGVARYSTAVVRILWHLGGIWRFVSWNLWLIPRPIRNWGYRVVATRRYQWFGKTEACRLPQPGETDRFLP